MSLILKEFILLISFLLIQSQLEQHEQVGIMNSKIKEYSQLLTLDLATISSNCEQIDQEYQKSIQAYDFVSTFTLETMEETLQKDLGNDLEQQASATFEQLALRGQLEETRTKRRLEELQWRVNWSSNAQSNEVSSEEINEMKEEITSISGDKQKELDDLIYQKTSEQTQLTEQIQLGESTYNKLNADKEDINAFITVLTDKLDENAQKQQEIIEANSTRGDKLATLELQFKFFEEKKREATSFEAIKQLSQLQMKTEEEINKIKNQIQIANETLSMIQQSNIQVNDSLSTKKAELQSIDLQIETAHTQLLQIKHDSNEIANLLQQAIQQQAILLSQIGNNDKQELINNQTIQVQSFLQLTQNKMNENQKQLQLTQQKIAEGKKQIEKLEKEELIYQNQFVKTEKAIFQVKQKLQSLKNKAEKIKLESELKKLNKKYQTIWQNYSTKKGELLKLKKLVITLENLKASFEVESIKKQQKAIETQKEQQHKHEQQIQQKSIVLDQKLKIKRDQKGQACNIHLNHKAKTKFVKEGPKTQTLKIIKKTITKSTSTSPAAPTIAQVNAKPIQTDKNIPTKSNAPIKDAYPVPEVGKSKIDTITTIITNDKIDVAQESLKRGKSVENIEELILKYEELVTLKEQFLEKELKIVEEKEQVIVKKEAQIKATQETIKKDVEKCKKEKNYIIESAKQERESKKYKEAEANLQKKLNELNKQLKIEFSKEQKIFNRKKQLETEEKKLLEQQAEIDKLVEEIEKKIFQNAAQEKNALIQLKKSEPIETNFVQKDEEILPTTEEELEQEDKQIEAEEILTNEMMNSFVEISIDTQIQQLQAEANEGKLNFESLMQFLDQNQKKLNKSLRHKDGIVHLLQQTNKLSEDLKTIFVSSTSNQDELKSTLKQVLNEITKLYEIAIVQRNLKQGQNTLLEKKRELMKLQSACLETKKILQQQQ